MQQLTIAISGMSCGGCVSAVRKALGAIPGLHVDAVTVGSATVSYDAARTTPAAIAKAVRATGFEPAIAGDRVAAGAVGAVSSGNDHRGASGGGSCCS